MPNANVGGGTIAYQTAGDGGAALVFVSGLGGTGRAWQPQLAAFGARYRVVTYDHRGTGASDRAPHAAIPGSELVVLESGGHALSKTRSAEFNRIVLDFLARHGS